MKAIKLIVVLMVVAGIALATPLATIVAINTLFNAGIPLNQWTYLSMAFLFGMMFVIFRKAE